MNYLDRYGFFAIFNTADDGISVEFPNLPGCLTCGSDFKEAFAMAQEAMALHIFGMEKDNEEIPLPLFPSGLEELQSNEAIVYIEVFMPRFRDAINNRAVKKTLTIPKWMNDLAEERNVNFSQSLQSELRRILGIEQ